MQSTSNNPERSTGLSETMTVEMVAVESPNLDTICFRGSAPLRDLTRISQTDVFDQVLNPEGLQRDLSRKHAAEAYDYAARLADVERPRAFPEVVLNVRDKAVLEQAEAGEAAGQRIMRLTFDLDKIERARSVKVSRVDGNHRLFYGMGDGRERDALDVMVPFQIHVGLTREQEANLFLDINAEQKGLNSSHLNVLRSRITPEQMELEFHPQRAYAMQLVNDAGSPLHDLVHMGGSKHGTREKGITRPLNFVAVENSIKRMLAKSHALQELVSDHGARYALIRAWWQAIREVYPEAWEQPGEYLVLKNIGVNAFGIVGATVIDRSATLGQVDAADMADLLRAMKDRVDWHKDSPDVRGRSGNRAALDLAGEMLKGMPKVVQPKKAGSDRAKAAA